MQGSGGVSIKKMDIFWAGVWTFLGVQFCNCETCFLQFCSATGYSLSMVCLIICSVHSYRNLYMITPYTMTLTDMHIEQIVVKSSPQLSCANFIYTRNDNIFSSTVFLDVCSPTSIISVLVHYIFWFYPLVFVLSKTCCQKVRNQDSLTGSKERMNVNYKVQLPGSSNSLPEATPPWTAICTN